MGIVLRIDVPPGPRSLIGGLDVDVDEDWILLFVDDVAVVLDDDETAIDVDSEAAAAVLNKEL